MKRPTVRRPSPGTAIACLALFVSLGGVSYGFATGSIDSREIKNETVQTQDVRRGAIRTQDVRNDTLRTEDLRNNEVRGVDIRNSTIRTAEVAIDSLNGQDIDESTFAGVDAATLAGQSATAFAKSSQFVPFSAALGLGGSRVLASSGPVSVSAQCRSGADGVVLMASTTGSAVTNGNDPVTPGSPRQLMQNAREGPGRDVRAGENAGFVVASNGKALHVDGESTVLGLNYAGGACFVSGVITVTG